MFNPEKQCIRCRKKLSKEVDISFNNGVEDIELKYCSFDCLEAALS